MAMTSPSSQTATDVSAWPALGEAIKDIPTDANPYEYVLMALMGKTPVVGDASRTSFIVNMSIIIGIYALCFVVASYSVFAKYRQGNFWLFRTKDTARGTIITPNTTSLFLVWSISFTVLSAIYIGLLIAAIKRDTSALPSQIMLCLIFIPLLYALVSEAYGMAVALFLSNEHRIHPNFINFGFLSLYAAIPAALVPCFAIAAHQTKHILSLYNAFCYWLAYQAQSWMGEAFSLDSMFNETMSSMPMSSTMMSMMETSSSTMMQMTSSDVVEMTASPSMMTSVPTGTISRATSTMENMMSSTMTMMAKRDMPMPTPGEVIMRPTKDGTEYLDAIVKESSAFGVSSGTAFKAFLALLIVCAIIFIPVAFQYLRLLRAQLQNRENMFGSSGEKLDSGLNQSSSFNNGRSSDHSQGSDATDRLRSFTGSYRLMAAEVVLVCAVVVAYLCLGVWASFFMRKILDDPMSTFYQDCLFYYAFAVLGTPINLLIAHRTYNAGKTVTPAEPTYIYSARNGNLSSDMVARIRVHCMTQVAVDSPANSFKRTGPSSDSDSDMEKPEKVLY